MEKVRTTLNLSLFIYKMEVRILTALFVIIGLNEIRYRQNSDSA